MYGSSFSLTYLYFSALAVAWGRCDIIFYGYNNHLLSSYKIFLEKEKKNKNHFASPDPQHPTSLPGKQLKIWFPPILSVDGERSKKEKKRKEKAHNNNAVRTTVKQKHKIRNSFFLLFFFKKNLQFSLGLAAQPSHIAGQIVQFVVVVGIRPFFNYYFGFGMFVGERVYVRKTTRRGKTLCMCNPLFNFLQSILQHIACELVVFNLW